MKDEVKVISRRKPTTVNGYHNFRMIKGHPNIFTDSVILLEDRTEAEIKKWGVKFSNLPDIEYSKVKNLYETKNLRNAIFICYERGEGKESPIAHLDVEDEKSIPINAEYYKWLIKEGYIIKSPKDRTKPLVLERNGKDVGLLMPLVEDYAKDVGKLRSEIYKEVS